MSVTVDRPPGAPPAAVPPLRPRVLSQWTTMVAFWGVVFAIVGGRVAGLARVAGIAFMLAAPIINPLVLLSTWVAYGGGARGGQMVAARGGLGLLGAMAVGTVVGRRGEGLLRRAAGGHAHDHEDRLGSFSEHLA